MKLQGFDSPLDQYKFAGETEQSILQSGGFTSVLLAKHKIVGRTVAIKIIDKEDKSKQTALEL